jgi:hypothetical protein
LSSCLVLSCLVLSCLVLSCLVLSCLVLSCLALPCVLSCLVFSCPISSCLGNFVSTPAAGESQSHERGKGGEREGRTTGQAMVARVVTWRILSHM